MSSAKEQRKAKQRRETILAGGEGEAVRLALPGQSLLVGLATVMKQMTNQKELAARARLDYRKVNKYLCGVVGRSDPTEKLLRTLECRPAEVRILRSCLEAWSELDTDHFSDADLEWVEKEVAEAARQHRRALKLLLRGGPRPEPETGERDWLGERLKAEEMREGLEECEAEERAAIVCTVKRYQSWSFAVVCAEWSERQASKCVDSALEWAELGCLAAERAQDDPSGLSSGRVQGYCRSHLANAIRVLGELPRSETEMLAALALWEAGEDPLGLLDPGRVLELAASLRADQGEPAEALRLLAKAAPISRRPAYVALTRGSALSDMGEYIEAAAVLIEAGRIIEDLGEPRLKNVQQFTLCSVLCHLGRHREAAVLLPEIRRSTSRLGDKLDSFRVLWLDGRIARGLGDAEWAIEALEAAAGAFAERDMHYDVALARFEAATLHLEVGHADRSAEIAGELVERFASCGDFKEAQKALELFVEAVATRRATTELACAVLRYLYLAQHQVLDFNREL